MHQQDKIMTNKGVLMVMVIVKVTLEVKGWGGILIFFVGMP